MGGYVDSIDHLLKGEEIKLKLLASSGERFPDATALRKTALRYTRLALVNRAARLSEPECRFCRLGASLPPRRAGGHGSCSSRRPERLLLTRAIGRRAVAFLKGARAEAPA